MVGVAVTDLKEQLPLCRCGVTDVCCVAAGPFFDLEYDLIIMISTTLVKFGNHVVCSWIAVSIHYGSVYYGNAHLVI